jgi:SAM-dependent methyltransferase
MRRIDYDTEQYQDYARGRALSGQQMQTWISAFGAVLPRRRPLAGLDVGSGTGRLTPALAQAFGPVTGVEPSVRMRLLLRANFSDHHPEPWWLDHFPRGLEADTALFQPLHEVIATFTAAGWRVAGFGMVTQPSDGTRASMLERLRLRTHSFFAQLSPDEVEAGLRSIEQTVSADPGAPSPALSEPLLTLERR